MHEIFVDCFARRDDGTIILEVIPAGAEVELREGVSTPAWVKNLNLTKSWLPVVVNEERCWVPEMLISEEESG